MSSDDPKILKAAGKLGFQKILRPKRLSTSYARHIDVIVHALRKIKKIVSNLFNLKKLLFKEEKLLIKELLCV